MNGSLHLWLIPLLPFAGFLINGILGTRLPKWLVTTVALLAPLAAFCRVLLCADWRSICRSGCTAWASSALRRNICQWINIGALHIDFSFVLDQLSLVMLLVVTGVGFLIHIYSVGYMPTKRATRATSPT